MFIFFRHKKSLAVFFLMLAVFGLAAQISFAEEDIAPPAESQRGNSAPGLLGRALGWIGGLSSQPALMIWTVLLFILQTLMSALLFIVSFFLDNIFYYNVALTPDSMAAVRDGWTIMRDIANSIFILVLLWIAFTIIFNIQNLGGSRLLVRVILVALLINFSLTLVSTVFGFANALARPFRDAIARNNNNDVAGIIISNVRLQTTYETPTRDILTVYKTGNYGNQPGCGLEALQDKSVQQGAGCILGAATVDFTTSLSRGFIESADVLGFLSRAVTMGISVVFMGLTILAFLVASITLIIRLVAMVFLSVLAPAAFLAAAMPGAKPKALWSRWLSELLCWAFYAPAFYFLFWLSFIMLEAMTKSLPPVSTGNFGSYVLAMLPLVIFFVFLWASVRIGKFMGCEGAGIAIDYGKMLGGFAVGAATGGAALGAAALARRAAPTMIEPALKRAGEIPVLRTITAPVTRRVTGYLESQKQKVSEQRKGIDGWSDEHLSQEYSRSLLAERKVAIAQILAERGKFDKLGAHQEQALGLAGQFDPKITLSMLKARPDMITVERATKAGISIDDVRRKIDAGEAKDEKEAAQLIIINKIRTDEGGKISDEIFDETKNPGGKEGVENVTRLLWKNLSSEHLKQMQRARPDMVRTMTNNLTPELAGEIRPEMYRFLSSNAAQGMGLTLPQEHNMPPALLRELQAAKTGEIERLDQDVADLEKTVERLSIAEGDARDAGNIRTAEDASRQIQRTRLQIEKLKDRMERLAMGVEELTGAPYRRREAPPPTAPQAPPPTP